MIDSFTGKYRFLSNFYSRWLEVGSDVFPTAEHAFQAAKTFDRAKRKEIMEAPSPGMAKRLGRTVVLRNDWEKVKDEVMYEVVRSKFTDPTLKHMLLATGDEELVEGNWHGDSYWGVDNHTGLGRNVLGQILMQVRDELRKREET